MEGKSVLLITRSLTSGGAERVMALLANSLSEKGINVTLAIMQNKDRTYFVNDKVKIIQFSCKSDNQIIISLNRLVRLRKLMKKHTAKTVISFLHIINFYTLIAGLGLKKKIIVSERSDPSQNKQWYYKLGRKLLYPFAHKIVFQTQESMEFFPKSIHKKGVIIPNPISPNLPGRYTSERERVIVAVGRLTEQKNFKMSLDAFYLLQLEFGDLQFQIYGEGSNRAKLEKYINLLGLKQKVKLVGYVKDVLDKIYKSAIYISSSNYEGISNSMMEAMALGIPSVITDCPVGGARMIVQNNKNGILIPVGNTQALYEGMKKILMDKEFANNISQNALKIRDTYSVNNICQLWNDIIV